MNELPSLSTSGGNQIDDFCTFHFYVTSQDALQDDKLYALFRDEHKSLQDELEVTVTENLGSQFEIEGMSIDRGSVDIVFKIVYTGYEIISRYKNFTESINLVGSFFKRQISKFASSRTHIHPQVKGSWIPGPAFTHMQGSSATRRAQLLPLWDWLFPYSVSLDYLGLLAAQIAFSIVSFITTFRGFYLLLANDSYAFLAALGVQLLVFWLPRRFYSHRSWKRRGFDMFSFACSVFISILFSYQSFVDILVPVELREQKSTEAAFSNVEHDIGIAMKGIDAAVAGSARKVDEYKENAKREKDEGGTKQGQRAAAGKGPVYFEWRSLEASEEAKLRTLQGLKDQVELHRKAIAELETKADDPKKKRSDLKYHVVTIIGLAQNPQIGEALTETETDKALAGDLSKLKPPQINIGEKTYGNVAVRDQFMESLRAIRSGVNDLFENIELSTFQTGAIVALLVATMLDFLILISGLVSSYQRVPANIRRFVTVLWANKKVKLVRHGKKLGLRVPRDDLGKAEELSRSEDIAAQILIENGYLEMLNNTSGNGANIETEILIIEDKNLLQLLTK